MDLEEWVEQVRSNVTDHELLDTNPRCAVQYTRSIAFIRSAKQQHDSRETRTVACWVYWGPAGHGKSYAARELARSNGGSYYRITEGNMDSNRRTIWFGSYRGESTLIVDDLNTGWIPYNVLLGLMEGYPLEIQTKGGVAWACWTRVIVTSNIDPENWFGVGSPVGYPEENKAALLSRLAQNGARGGVIEFDEPAEVNRASTEFRKYRISELRSRAVTPPRDN